MIEKLLKLLGLENNYKFKLETYEALGMLCLCNHWMRGIVDALIQNGNVQLTSDQRANWERVIKDLALYEEFLWEILPSRAMLLQLREFRKTGELQEGFEDLILKDTHGRVPYKLDNKTLDDIEDVVRRIKDVRQTATPFCHANNLLNIGKQIN